VAISSVPTAPVFCSAEKLNTQGGSRQARRSQAAAGSGLPVLGLHRSRTRRCLGASMVFGLARRGSQRRGGAVGRSRQADLW